MLYKKIINNARALERRKYISISIRPQICINTSKNIFKHIDACFMIQAEESCRNL